MFNIAIIGAGVIGANHARIYSKFKDIHLVGIVEPIEERGKVFSEKYNCKHYSSIEQLLENQKVDAVSITVPTIFHGQVGLAALKKNIHVLMEKPIAFRENEASKLIKEAKKKEFSLTRWSCRKV